MKTMYLCVVVLVFLATGTSLIAADASDVTSRYHVGDWAIYRVMGIDAMRHRHFIIAIDGEEDDAHVTIAVESVANPGKILAKISRTFAEIRREDEATKAKISRTEKIMVGDREIVADVIDESKDGKKVTIHGSNHLPVGGLIRIQEEGQPPFSEMVDYGWGDSRRK